MNNENINEEWREIPGYPDYEVSNLGRVRSWRWSGGRPEDVGEVRRTEPLILKPRKDTKGYLRVGLVNGEGRKNFRVHRLVLITFTNEEPDGCQAAHNNGNPADNRLNNLRWATPRENNADKVLHGTQAHGSKNGQSKLTEEIVREARELYVPHSREFGSVALAKKYGVSQRVMHMALTGETWTRVTESTDTELAA